MLRRVVALVLGLMLVAAACGDDASSEETGVLTDPDLTIPDVVGESADFARGVLEAGGFRPDIIEVVDEAVDPGTVLEQVPAAGTGAFVGATVILKVAVASDSAATTTTAATSETTTTTAGATSGSSPPASSTTTTTTTATTTTTTTLADQVAPDDGGDGSSGSSPEHSVTVVAENNNPDAVVFNGAISVPGDRGDGIRITVDNLFQGTNQDNANTQVTFVCSPGGPRVRSAPSGYTGGSACDAAYTTSFFSTNDSENKTYFIYVPDGVMGYFQYTLTLVSVRS